jgi:hypothetical protein
MAGGSLIRPRLLIYPLLVCILWLAAQTYSHAARRLVVSAASALAIFGIVINAVKYKEFNEYLHEYVSGAHLVEPYTTLLPISFTSSTAPDADWFAWRSPDPLRHASGYIAAEIPLVDLSNYEAATNHFPTALRVGHDPYSPKSNWEKPYAKLDLEDYNPTGQRADYVLLWNSTGVERNLDRSLNIGRQLAADYALLYTSRRGVMRLYRRKNFKDLSHWAKGKPVKPYSASHR